MNSASTNFLAFIINDELQVWETSNKSKCLHRFTPTDFKTKAKITCSKLSQHSNMLLVGLSDGQIVLIDCTTCSVIKQLKLGNDQVMSITVLNKNQNAIVVACKNETYKINISQNNLNITSTFQHKKKQIPNFICISPNDCLLLQCFDTDYSIVDLNDGKIIRSEQGAHSSTIAAACWVDNHMYVTSGGNQVCVWTIEQSEPRCLLETFKQQITQLTSKPSSKNRVYIVASSSKTSSVFKINNDLKKVYNPTCKLMLQQGIEQIYDATLLSNTHISLVYGSQFGVVKKSFEVVDGVVNVEIQDAKEVQKVNKANEQYSVQEIQVVNETNLRLLPSDALQGLESAVTSVSNKRSGHSLTAVLQQALQSDDQEQLDWILAQRDHNIVNSTVESIKTEYIGRLFAVILTRFQQEKPAQDLLSVLLWLRLLIKHNWASILKLNNVQDMQKLLIIQEYINKKTHNLQKYISVQGKLEMAKRAVELKRDTSRPVQQALIYKDADVSMSDEQEELEEESEEEIKEIMSKNQSDQELDDSVSDDQESEQMMYGDESQDVNQLASSDSDEQMVSDMDSEDLVR